MEALIYLSVLNVSLINNRKFLYKENSFSVTKFVGV